MLAIYGFPAEKSRNFSVFFYEYAGMFAQVLLGHLYLRFGTSVAMSLRFCIFPLLSCGQFPHIGGGTGGGNGLVSS